uniref:ALOG domain-containing protein n=1 Tax=Elaeophora elaphi TaxID=1147741 RepID=A0A0R3RH19_9BILA
LRRDGGGQERTVLAKRRQWWPRENSDDEKRAVVTKRGQWWPRNSHEILFGHMLFVISVSKLEEMTKELQYLLDQYPVFEFDERQKLRCTLTGHEIPSRFDQLDHYVRTSKFVRAWKTHQIMKEYGEYFDDISPHEFGCKITRKIIAKDPDDLLRHINGKRFKKGLAKGLFVVITSTN